MRGECFLLLWLQFWELQKPSWALVLSMSRIWFASRSNFLWLFIGRWCACSCREVCLLWGGDGARFIMNVCFALSSAIPSLWGDQRWILMKSIQVLVTMLNPMSIGFECSNPISMFIHFFKSLNACLILYEYLWNPIQSRWWYGIHKRDHCLH